MVITDMPAPTWTGASAIPGGGNKSELSTSAANMNPGHQLNPGYYPISNHINSTIDSFAPMNNNTNINSTIDSFASMSNNTNTNTSMSASSCTRPIMTATMSTAHPFSIAAALADSNNNNNNVNNSSNHGNTAGSSLTMSYNNNNNNIHSNNSNSFGNSMGYGAGGGGAGIGAVGGDTYAFNAADPNSYSTTPPRRDSFGSAHTAPLYDPFAHTATVNYISSPPLPLHDRSDAGSMNPAHYPLSHIGDGGGFAGGGALGGGVVGAHEHAYRGGFGDGGGEGPLAGWQQWRRHSNASSGSWQHLGSASAEWAFPVVRVRQKHKRQHWT